MKKKFLKEWGYRAAIVVLSLLVIGLVGRFNAKRAETDTTQHWSEMEAAESYAGPEESQIEDGWVLEAQEVLEGFRVAEGTYDFGRLAETLTRGEKPFFSSQEGSVVWGFNTPGGAYAVVFQSVVEENGELTTLLEIAENFTRPDGTYRQWFYFSQGGEMIHDSTYPELVVNRDIVETLLLALQGGSFKECPFAELDLKHYCFVVNEGEENSITTLGDPHDD